MTRIYTIILTTIFWSCNQNLESFNKSFETDDHETQTLASCKNKGLSSVNQDSLQVLETISSFIRNQQENVKNDSLTFLTGYVFSNHITHKYIRVSNFSGTYVQVYSSNDNYRKPIFSVRLGWMSFVSDSIFDINGDKVIDLAIHWYPSSGCCLADIYDCYLYNQKIDQFSEKVEIPNPTFYPDRNLTFSMSYGHPGETEFREFKWTNNNLDTTKKYQWNDRTQDHIVLSNIKSGIKTELDEIPEEIKELNGIEWFMMRIKNEEE